MSSVCKRSRPVRLGARGSWWFSARASIKTKMSDVGSTGSSARHTHCLSGLNSLNSARTSSANDLRACATPIGSACAVKQLYYVAHTARWKRIQLPHTARQRLQHSNHL
eukprot:353851-Chlamydomonas_euryale.AAC.13